MFRKAGVVAAVVTAVGLASAPGASAAGGCVLKGAADISQGLTTTQKPINYTFSGTVTNCKGVPGLKKGTINASGSGTGACTGNKTSGLATINWSTGQTSGISYTTNGTGVFVRVAGRVISGVLAGQKVSASLLFYTAQAAQCNSAGGLHVAQFAGPATLGA
jgi:hypothetical protein